MFRAHGHEKSAAPPLRAVTTHTAQFKCSAEYPVQRAVVELAFHYTIIVLFCYAIPYNSTRMILLVSTFYVFKVQHSRVQYSRVQ